MSRPDEGRCRECRCLNDPGALFCARCGASLVGPLNQGTAYPRRRISAAGAAMAFAMFLILLATVFVLGFIVYRTVKPTQAATTVTSAPGIMASTSTTTSPTGTTGSTTGTTGATTVTSGNTNSTAAGIQVRPEAATASSVLAATNTVNYGAANLMDGEVTTAWNEGAKGTGVGEWVRFNFAQSVTLTRIEIANGYQIDAERFKGNERVRSLKVEYSNGAVQAVDLQDTEDLQYISALPVMTDWVKLTIAAVYPDYVWAVAALSEVHFFAVSAQQ